MSENINNNELNDVSGGKPAGAAGTKNLGHKCKWFVCNACGAVPYLVDYDVLGVCRTCGVQHVLTASYSCPHGDTPVESCDHCKYDCGGIWCAVRDSL